MRGLWAIAFILVTTFVAVISSTSEGVAAGADESPVGVVQSADPGDAAPALKPLSTFRDCADCPTMVVIPPGNFMMGASAEDREIADRFTIASELPRHRVTIKYSFAVGRYHVTVDEFAAFVKQTGTRTGGECTLRVTDLGPHAGEFIGKPKPGQHNPPGLVTITNGTFRMPGKHVTGKYPVTCISRKEALKYIQWLSKKSGRHYRLLTEAESEYVTRAGSTTAYPFAGPVTDLCKYGNFADSASPYGASIAAPCAENPSPQQGTAPVGSYQPNAWGIYDTIGNVFEFIEDCRFANYKGAPTDGSAHVAPKCAAFVTRGFFFDSIYTDMRSASRCTAGDTATERENFVSLRVAVSLDNKAWDRKQ